MERYPIGETELVRVEVRRVERGDGDADAWSVCLLVREGETLVRLPGHYGAVLAERLRDAAAAVAAGVAGGVRRTYRDEFLDLTAVDGAVVLSSSMRSPLRVSLRLPEDDLDALAALLDGAAELVDTLRRGVSLVPDALPEELAG
jgi:hypothetical protein